MEVITGITGSSSGSRSYDISAYMAADTQIWFGATNGYDGISEDFVVDDVQIAFSSATAHTMTGGAGNDSFIGGNLADTITGAAGDDRLEGGAGGDNIDGGSGTDTASYEGSGSAVTIDLDASTASGGDAAGDTLTSIENFIGSSNNDTLTGDGSSNVIDGGAGSDSVYGLGGDDIIVWDAANAVIDGGSGSDTLQVDSGDVDLTTFAGTIQGIENIDLEADAGPNSLTLTVQDVLDISDTDTLTIVGTSVDSVNAGTSWTDGGFDGGGNHIYTQMVGASLATLVVDPDVAVNPDILM